MYHDKPPSHLSRFGRLVEELTNFRQLQLLEFASLLKVFGKIRDQERVNNQLNGTGFNPLEQFVMDERTHTILIGNLLNRWHNHGQDDRFLLLLLTKLGIRLPEKGIWSVQVETANVDILLKREKPHSVVIIENKSNYAVDQPGQLYRYWYEQIYLPNKRIPGKDFALPATYHQEDVKDRYKIVYLAPSRFKIPTTHSLQIPSWMAVEPALPRELPLQWEHGIYNELVVDWLRNCVAHVPNTNHRLREYLNMYIEFWNTKSIQL